MTKKYLKPIVYLLFLIIFSNAKSQEVLQSEKQTDTIDGLSIYPNPTSGDKIYITSNKGLTKQVKIYDVLGERVLFKVLVGGELDVTTLNSGVYYVEITEHENSESVKLIVRK